MKRIFAFLLVILLLLSCASCGSEPTASPVDKTDGKEEDISLLSPEALYERGLKKTRALSAFSAETEVLLGEEAVDSIQITRLREGYDGFSYSRTGQVSLYFSEGKIYTATSLGSYCATATARDAQDYMNTYVFPVQLLEEEWIGDLQKEGMTLTFSLKNDAVLKLFAQAAVKDGTAFLPESMTGKIEVNKEGVFEREEYTVLGQNTAGESVTLVLSTHVEKISGDTELQLPTTEYVSLDDIRIPHYLRDGKEKLVAEPNLQVTILGSESVKSGEQSLSRHLEETFYRNGLENAYLSRQSLKNVPVLPEGAEAPVQTEESRFYQFLLENGVKKENEYDVLTGTLLSENQTAAGSADWNQILEEVLLDPAFLGEFTLSKDRENITVSFSLNERGAKKLAERLLLHLPESGLDLSAATGTGSGVLSLSADTHLLTAFSVVLEGSASAASFSSRYSLTVDATENITFPAWQTPTATTPGEMGDAHDHDH